MPVIIANNWNALREGFDTDAEGNKFFTGDVIVTFWLDSIVPKMYVNGTMETDVPKNTPGVIVKKQARDEDGKLVVDNKGKPVMRHYKITYEHQAVVKKVTKSANGFDGWTIVLPRTDITVCLPKGRGQLREVVVEPTVASTTETNETTDIKQQIDKKKEEVKKTKMVRTQPDEILNAIFTVR